MKIHPVLLLVCAGVCSVALRSEESRHGDQKDPRKQLIEACERHHWKTAEKILQKSPGAPKKFRCARALATGTGFTPLMDAAAYNRDLDRVIELLEKAAAQGHKKSIKELRGLEYPNMSNSAQRWTCRGIWLAWILIPFF